MKHYEQKEGLEVIPIVFTNKAGCWDWLLGLVAGMNFARWQNKTKTPSQKNRTFRGPR